MQLKQRLLIAAGLMASLVPAQAFVQVRTLHDGWKVRNASSEIWHEAQVPGNLHLDLMRAHVIDDPFYRLNERSVQWIDKENWMYETYITPTEAELDAKIRKSSSRDWIPMQTFTSIANGSFVPTTCTVSGVAM